MYDTPNGEVRNKMDAPAVTVRTEDGARPLDDVLDDLGGVGAPSWDDITDKPSTYPPAAHTHNGLMEGDAPSVPDSTAEDVETVVNDLNNVIAALRARGVLA